MGLVTVNVFRKAHESVARCIVLVAVEGLFIAIGTVIAIYILPMLESKMQESNLTLPELTAFGLKHYRWIVVALVLHAVITAGLLPRMPKAIVPFWLAFGAMLPLLIVIVPFMMVMSVYGVILEDLQ